MKKVYKTLQELANHEVWPYCAEGMGVDGDEITQTLYRDGRIEGTSEGLSLNISTLQVRDYVTEAYEADRRL